MGYGCPHPVYSHPGSLPLRVSQAKGTSATLARYRRQKSSGSGKPEYQA